MKKQKKSLDELIAEKIMSQTPQRFTDGNGLDQTLLDVPHYSTDIASAWKVVDQLQGVWDLSSFANGWVVKLAVRANTSDIFVSAAAPTVMEAICIAALKTKGIDFSL